MKEISFLNVEAHEKYFQRSSEILPSEYVGLESSRLTAIYFIVASLDLLEKLENIDKMRFIEYIYSLQLASSNYEEISKGAFGFIGSHWLTFRGQITENLIPYKQGNLAMTYSALVSLLTLSDDLSRVNKTSIQLGLRHLQQDNGSFSCYLNEGEADIRFVFCACAIASILNIWDSINIDKTCSYIKSCLTYEGGLSLQPGQEAQGGSTFCGIAALSLMNKLSETFSSEELIELISWCERKLEIGFQGRTNKIPDSCYSFWFGATLKILERIDDLSFIEINGFLCQECQSSKIGGFSKLPKDYPDLMHSFYSLCWFSLIAQENTLDPVIAVLSSKSRKSIPCSTTSF